MSEALAGFVVGVVLILMGWAAYSDGKHAAATSIREQCESFQAFKAKTSSGEVMFYCYREPKK